MDKQDLEQIKEVVSAVIRQEVPGMIELGINNALENVVMPQFDLIHSRIDKVASDLADVKREVVGLKNQTASKGWVEDRLDNFRIDHGLIYKPAV